MPLAQEPGVQVKLIHQEVFKTVATTTGTGSSATRMFINVVLPVGYHPPVPARAGVVAPAAPAGK